ncbi:MAG: LysR family transcriptional regulator [Glaciimonas sp.]|nr:LysR family transcriptional regulator [Glaciimonas sp.]
MYDLNDMYLFAKVVEQGGYSAAARHLGMQVSRLSRRISELESSLGVRLLNRTTRKISMTDVGNTFYQHCIALVAEAQAARDTIDRTRAEPQGLVRLSCPVGLLHSHVATIVTRFLLAKPLVRVHVEATNRRVDVVEEGFDIALRVRSLPLEDSNLAVRLLANTELILLGSPGLFALHGKPQQIADLSRFPTLSMTRPGDKYLWQFTKPDGGVEAVAHQPRLATDDFVTLRRAALNGLGITYLPKFMVQEDLASGALEHVLPELAIPQGVVHALFPSRRGLVPAVRDFIDALVEGFAAGEQALLQ